VEDDIDVWRYAISELRARNDDDDDTPAEHRQVACLTLIALLASGVVQCSN